jgi:hypothetical protein
MVGENTVFIGIFQRRPSSRSKNQRSFFPENIPAASLALSPPGDHAKKNGLWFPVLRISNDELPVVPLCQENIFLYAKLGY